MVPAAGVRRVDGVEDPYGVGGTGSELVDYNYQQCLLRNWYRNIWMYVVGVLLAMLGVWLMKRSLRFVWNLLGLIGWLKPFLDGVKLFYMIVTCCGRCAFDMTSCLVSCMLQVGRLCGFVDADYEVGANGPDEDASRAVGGAVGGDSVEEIGAAGGAARVADEAAGVAGKAAGVAGVESIKMKKLGERDRIAKVHGGGGGDRVGDGGKAGDVGLSGSISPRLVFPCFDFSS